MDYYVCALECTLQDEDLAYPGAELHFLHYLRALAGVPGVLHVERGAFTSWDDRADRFIFRATVVVTARYPFRADPIDAMRPGICEGIAFSEWTGPFT